MKANNSGFEILVNHVPRSFRDREDTAYAAALFLKARWPHDQVTIVDLACGKVVVVRADGRTE